MEYLLGLLFFRKILLMNRFADKSGDPRELLHCPQQDRTHVVSPLSPAAARCLKRITSTILETVVETWRNKRCKNWRSVHGAVSGRTMMPSWPTPVAMKSPSEHSLRRGSWQERH